MATTSTDPSESESVIESLDYFPYGGLRVDTKTNYGGVRNKYAGTVYDALSGLNYAMARYQNSSRGQFVSEDPSVLAVGDPNQVKQVTGQDQNVFLADPQQLNSYGYGRDNPITRSDPNGDLAFVPFLIAAIAVYNTSMSAIDLYSAAQADALPSTQNEFSRDEKIDANMQVGYDIVQSKATNIAARAGLKDFSPLIGMLQAMSDAWTKGPDTVRYYRSGAFANDMKDYTRMGSNKLQQAQSLSTIFNSGSTVQARSNAVSSYNAASGATSNESKLWLMPNGAVVTWTGAVVSSSNKK